MTSGTQQSASYATTAIECWERMAAHRTDDKTLRNKDDVRLLLGCWCKPDTHICFSKGRHCWNRMHDRNFCCNFNGDWKGCTCTESQTLHGDRFDVKMTKPWTVEFEVVYPEEELALLSDVAPPSPPPPAPKNVTTPKAAQPVARKLFDD